MSASDRATGLLCTRLPSHRHVSVHLIRAHSGLVCRSQSSLPAVCLKVRASSQLQQLNIKLAAAASPSTRLTQSIALHYSWGRTRWPLIEGWISTVPNFTGAGGRVTPSTTAYRQRKMTTCGTRKGQGTLEDRHRRIWGGASWANSKANLYVYFLKWDSKFDMRVWRPLLQTSAF